MKTTLKPNEVAACPQCDSSSVEVRRSTGMRTSGDSTERYKCTNCGDAFDEYTVRVRKNVGSPNGLAKKLADADPEDLGL